MSPPPPTPIQVLLKMSGPLYSSEELPLVPITPPVPEEACPLVLGHVTRPVGGCLHGIHDGGSERSLLQLVQGVDRGAPGRADVPPQLRRVLPCLQQHLGCTLQDTKKVRFGTSQIPWLDGITIPTTPW